MNEPNMSTSDEERRKLEEARLSKPVADWLTASRRLLQDLIVVQTLADEVPEVVGASPLAYVRAVRDQLAELDRLMAVIESGGRGRPDLCADAGLRSALDLLRSRTEQMVRDRISLERLGIDPDAED